MAWTGEDTLSKQEEQVALHTAFSLIYSDSGLLSSLATFKMEQNGSNFSLLCLEVSFELKWTCMSFQ